MELDILALKNGSIELNVFICIINRLLNQLDPHNLFATNLTQAQSDCSSPAANIQKRSFSVNLSKLFNLQQHVFKYWRVHLEECERRHTEFNAT